MTDPEKLDNIPHATVRPKRKIRLSVVWIIPILAALVGLGIAVQKILNEGPTITIVFNKAEGVEAGKTNIKYKDVSIGQVQTVKLSKNFTKVVVTAKIDKSAEGLIVEDAKFWIESPRVTLSGVSGMGTVLSGNHIGLETGKSSRARREFTGLDMPPSITVDQPGRQFVLQADTLGSVGIGSPVYYRQLNVGRVISYDLTTNGKSIEIKVFVNAPYDRHVTTQTRFWHASGIDISMGTNGLSVQTQSVLSILIGGIAFEEPDSTIAESKPAAEGTVFNLFGDRATATKKHEELVSKAVLYFKESLRGLSVGAPVTFAGLPVGEVTGVGLEFNPATDDIQPRVDMVLYPAHFLAYMKSESATQKATSQQWRGALVQRMVDRGLRAQLRSSSLVTGQLYIALDYFPNAAKVKKLDYSKIPYEFPVMPGSLQDMENKLSGIIARIDKMPLDVIGEDARKTIETLNRLLNHIDAEMVPEIKTTLRDLRKTLASADDTLVGKDAPTQQELRAALQEVARAARSISELVDYLERNPDALIRGKAQEVPK